VAKDAKRKTVVSDATLSGRLLSDLKTIATFAETSLSPGSHCFLQTQPANQEVSDDVIW
jgi:hypothetical protein